MTSICILGFYKILIGNTALNTSDLGYLCHKQWVILTNQSNYSYMELLSIQYSVYRNESMINYSIKRCRVHLRGKLIILKKFQNLYNCLSINLIDNTFPYFSSYQMYSYGFNSVLPEPIQPIDDQNKYFFSNIIHMEKERKYK